jgi:hypothetical protein
MKYIASCSFGKDSIAAIITAKEMGLDLEEAVYVRVMFDDKISAELPDHEQWIWDVAIPTLRDKYNIKTTVLQSDNTYIKQFWRKFERGKKVGQIYGFPMLRTPWCNNLLKIKEIHKWEREAAPHIQIIGLAADETKRIAKTIVAGTFLPLVEAGITEEQAFSVARGAGLLSPAYNNGRTRLGCWFCHNQRICELKRLRSENPEYFSLLMSLESVSPVKFKPNKTLSEFESRFAREDAEPTQITIFDYLQEGKPSNYNEYSVLHEMYQVNCAPQKE